jgi:aminopeptidase N
MVVPGSSAAGQTAAPAAPPAASQLPTGYTITLVPSDTGRHLLAEVETNWRLRTVNPVELVLDGGLRVVRVLVDGKPNTRVARTMYARQDSLIVVPHEKAPGDTLTTRVRYHGIPPGGAVVGTDHAGARTMVAQSAVGAASRWLPVPAGLAGASPDPADARGADTGAAAPAGVAAAVPAAPRVSVTWQVQASTGQRVIANGQLTGIDTLSYGHTTWHYRLDQPVPLTALAAAAGHYAMAAATRACRSACPPVTIWTAPQDSAAAASGPLGHAGEIMDWLTARLGPYPYPALAHVTSALVPGGAVAASVALYDEAQLRSGAVTETDVARATAAQWLGLATSDSTRPGPAEATAGYLAWLWTRERHPGPSVIMLTRDLDAIRALHQAVGDSAFYRGLRRWLERHPHQAASSRDYEQAMAEAAGKRLAWSWAAAAGGR